MQWMLFWIVLVNGQMSVGYEPYETKVACEAALERLEAETPGQLSVECFRVDDAR